MDFLYKPWPWYVAGPIIGLTVPALLLLGNKRLGISSTLRQLCAACYPGQIRFLRYDWKKEIWNLYFVTGIFIGGILGATVFDSPINTDLSKETTAYLQGLGLVDLTGLLPVELFNWSQLLTLPGFLLMCVGGFLVGFGTRYARGCTSGHGIFGVSSLQWTSLLAIAAFFLGGIVCSHAILPYLLSL
jgi:uncharacterized membrane protein YedE/YeeE